MLHNRKKTALNVFTSKLWSDKVGIFHALATRFDVLVNSVWGHCERYKPFYV